MKEIIELGAETILANDNSYEAKYLVEQLMNFYSFLDSQKGSSDYCTLFDNVRFKRYMRSFFPGGRTGIGNYHSSKFNKNQLAVISKTRRILLKIYSDMPSL